MPTIRNIFISALGAFVVAGCGYDPRIDPPSELLVGQAEHAPAPTPVDPVSPLVGEWSTADFPDYIHQTLTHAADGSYTARYQEHPPQGDQDTTYTGTWTATATTITTTTELGTHSTPYDLDSDEIHAWGRVYANTTR